MAAITLQRLKQLVADAYKSGYHGCLDMQDGYVEDSMNKLMEPMAPILSANDGWKTWTIKELRALEAGTILEHATRGKGWIEHTSTERFITWTDSTVSHFYKDDVPWLEPMRVIGKIKTGKPPKSVRRNTIGSNFGAIV